MSQRSARHRLPLHAVLAAVGALVLVPVPLLGAATAPAGSSVSASATTTTGAECAVTDGTLTWGFKESFRSYISGTIANGAWEAIDGATYTTPEFGWSGATGTWDPETLAGEVHFPGGAHFTGHDGLLDTTIVNPTLSFAGDGSGRLLLDVTSLSMDDALAGNTENVQTLSQVPFVSLDLAAAPVESSTDEQITVVGTAVPTAITQEGYDAFGSYDVGTAFDPATFSFTVECAEPEPEPTATLDDSSDAGATPEATASDDPADLTWLAWVGGVVGVGVVAALVIWIVRRGRGGSTRTPDQDGQE